MDRYISRILSHPKRNIGILCILVLLFGYYGVSVRMDNSMEVWLPEQSAARIQYERYLEDFGSEEFILVAFHLPRGLTRDNLRIMHRLSHSFKSQEGIRNVWSLPDIFDRPWEHFEVFKNIIHKSSFCRGTLISRDEKAAAIIIIPSSAGLKNRITLIEKIKNLVSSEVPDDMEVFVAGPPVINAELDRLSQRVSARYSPILFFVCLIMLLFFFRSLAGIAVPALMMVCCMLVTAGWIGMFSASLNIITVACFPLIMVISLSYSLYVYNAYQSCLLQEKSKSLPDYKKRSLVSAYRNVSLPVFLSALTTAVGFGSLVVSDIIPVRNLGLFVALGILSTFLLAMTFLPVALFLFPLPEPSSYKDVVNECLSELLRLSGMLATRSKTAILCFCLFVLLVALCGVFRLSVETHILTFFKKDSALAEGYAFIENNLTGLSPIEIIIESKRNPPGDILRDHDALRKIKNLQKYLEQTEGVVSTQSAVNILQDKTRADFVDLLFVSKEPMFAALDAALKGFVNDDRTATRVSVRAKTLGSIKFQALMRDINHYLQVHFENGLRAYATGVVPVIVDMQDTLLKNLIKSFAIAFGVICFIFMVLLRSAKNTIICMIPNILPVMVILGFMGWLRIKLDVATVMIASIAIGIAVDDTIHFIFRFRQERSSSGDYAGPVLATLSSTGKPIVHTSLVTLCGFLVLCFSGFNPMIYFGLLTGLSIIAALLGDIIVLPALLVAFNVKFK